jgi:predicted glutamine amidotransferase
LCGIVGLFGPPNRKALAAFEGMLAADIVRGKDSTGVAAVQNNGNVSLVKETCFPMELMRTAKYRKQVQEQGDNITALIGHNRFATRGQVTAENAHPFHVGHVVMAHNGTLNEHLKPDKETYRTDSHSLAHAIAKQGIEWTWKELNGPAAVVFYDSKQQSYNLLTNGQRPLHFALTEDQKHLFVASEEWTIEDVIPSYGFKIYKTVFFPKPDVLFSFKYDEKKKRIVEESTELDDRFSAMRYKWKGNGAYHSETRPFRGQNNSSGAAVLHPPGEATSKDTTTDTVDHIMKANAYLADKKEPTSFSDIIAEINEAGWCMVKDVMTEKEFVSNNYECIFCRDDLEKKFNDTALIDEDNAVCFNCATVAIKNANLVGVK